MDQAVQELQATQQSSSILALLAIVLIVAVVLVAVVIIQQRKIRDMQQPKYGFLGKPLNAFVLLGVMLGGLGFVYYSTYYRTNEFVDVSADSSVDANIVITQVDPANRTYQFNVLPSIDNNEWGGSNVYNFDVYWTVSNGDVNTQIELGLNSQKTGGIRLSLKQGVYTVRATVYISDRSVEKETTLEVE